MKRRGIEADPKRFQDVRAGKTAKRGVAHVSANIQKQARKLNHTGHVLWLERSKNFLSSPYKSRMFQNFHDKWPWLAEIPESGQVAGTGHFTLRKDKNYDWTHSHPIAGANNRHRTAQRTGAWLCRLRRQRPRGTVKNSGSPKTGHTRQAICICKTRLTTGEHGTSCVLMFDFMCVLIRGKNLCKDWWDGLGTRQRWILFRSSNPDFRPKPDEKITAD